MPLTEFENLESLRPLIGKEIAVSDWFTVTQERINQFAEATGDHQWIHVDVERAQRESPYKATIAHGFLTLSLLAGLAIDTIKIKSVKMGVNYGLNRVRFTDAVPAGSNILYCRAWKMYRSKMARRQFGMSRSNVKDRTSRCWWRNG
jgi:acyl dehydratase